MPTSASSQQFIRLTRLWKLVALRGDIDNIVIEVLGHFSLEKIYSENNNAGYQSLVENLIAQLNAIFFIQRLSLPSGNLEVRWYLSILASWEVILRSVEFVLHTVIEGRESLWEARLLRDKYLPEFLISALRVLQLMPQGPANEQANDRQERYARIQRLLENVYHSYPGPRSFLLSVCKEIINSLQTKPDSLALPPTLRDQLPNLASELYPLPECLCSKYVSTVVPQNGLFDEWLSQFLALRDIAQFVVGASVQYSVHRETHNAYIQSSSASVRTAIFGCLENIELPPQFSKGDMVAVFSEIFRIVFPDAQEEGRRDSLAMHALDMLCARLDQQQLLHRFSDREMMHRVSDITQSITLLDDPSGQFTNPTPKVYVLNCQKCHFAGDTQLRFVGDLKLPLDALETTEIKLPAQSKCIECGEPVTMMREVPLLRHVWNSLKALELDADSIVLERHLPSQFELGVPKIDTSMPLNPRYSGIPGIKGGEKLYDPINPDRSRSLPLNLFSPVSPASTVSSRLDTARSQPSFSDNVTSIDERSLETWTSADSRKPSAEVPFSPDSIGFSARDQSQLEKVSSTKSLDKFQVTGSQGPELVNAQMASSAEKKKFGWFKSKKEAAGPSVDTNSLSSTTLESQRLEEISLESLIVPPKKSARKSTKCINVHLSQNSTHALFWAQSMIQIWDIGTSPPTMKRTVVTESACVKAAATNKFLAYIIGTRGQKLTLRIVNIERPSAPIIEYRMPSSPWCFSLTICPNQSEVAVGFDNAIVRFFKTGPSEEQREHRLHVGHHKEARECKERECPPVDTLSYSSDGIFLLGSTRSNKNGLIVVYSWRFPFRNFQELPKCRYPVPLHESEDNGVSSAMFRSGSGLEENLICITTWTQSGVPVLIQPESGHKTDVKTDSSHQSKIGNRIQSAAFSPSGTELALVNDRGHLYHISNVNSNPLDIRKVATSKELTTRSDSFSMAFVSLPGDERAIVLAWADPSKAVGFIKVIPLQASGAETSISTTPVPPKSGLAPMKEPAELSADAKAPSEEANQMNVTEEPLVKYRIEGFPKRGYR